MIEPQEIPNYYQEYLDFIIKHLKEAQYDLDDWNFENVKTNLTSFCSSRCALLFWIIRGFGLTYTIQEQRAFDKGVRYKILNDLSALGLCKSHDINLIEATASVKAQLKFWKHLFQMRTRLRFNSAPDQNYSVDQLLHNLVSSPHFEDSLKDTKLELLPKDMKIRLKNTEIKKNQIIHTALPEATELVNIEEPEPPTVLLKEVCGLRARNEALVSLHADSMVPWYKAAAAVTQPSSKTGDLVSNTLQELSQFRMSLSLNASIGEENDALARKMNLLQMETCQNASSVLEEVAPKY